VTVAFSAQAPKEHRNLFTQYGLLGEGLTAGAGDVDATLFFATKHPFSSFCVAFKARENRILWVACWVQSCEPQQPPLAKLSNPRANISTENNNNDGACGNYREDKKSGLGEATESYHRSRQDVRSEYSDDVLVALRGLPVQACASVALREQDWGRSKQGTK
jgi:hypothetical protein